MALSKPAETLLAALQIASGGRAKLDLDAIRTTFLNAFPQWQGSAGRRERLRELLDELANAQQLRRPSDGRRGWEQAPAPPLPRWVMLVREVAPVAASFDHRNFPWVAALAFAAGLPAVKNPDELRRIHDFLKDHPERRPITPVKERSFQIFGDEKRLDALRKSQYFAPARLTLELLRCRDVPASLPSIPAPRPSPGAWLIVENEAAFHSFARMNSVLALHGGIVLGSGLNVLRAVDFLAALAGSNTDPTTTAFDYSGDLDRNGIEIAADLDRRLRRRSLPGAAPARCYYQWLLETRLEPASSSTRLDLKWPALEWFPEDLRSKVAFVVQGKPLAQEAIGWEYLASSLALSSEIAF